jgi:hypothetical protein
MSVAIDAGKLIIIAGQMAIGATETRVPPRLDRKTMGKNSLGPGDMGREVTILAGRRITGRLMVRVGRAIVICGVTSITIFREVVALAMARIAT